MLFLGGKLNICLAFFHGSVKLSELAIEHTPNLSRWNRV